jgi:hypothetical protein
MESKHTTVVMGSPSSDAKAKVKQASTLALGAISKAIQFGSLDLVTIQVTNHDISTRHGAKEILIDQ